MISTRQLIILAVVYTVMVAVMVSVADVSGGVVFGVAATWFFLGRMIGRSDEVSTRRTRWGRQP